MKLGICGTFDLQNFGDLLFPLIARSELDKRLGAIELRPYAYHSRSAPAWPFDVHSLTRLASDIDTIDGLLVGGGHLIRFDKNVAPNYLPPDPAIPHPTGYWLSPAALAISRGCPLVWNAPGLCGEIPEWAYELMKLVLQNSSYIAVRDEPSRDALTKFAGDVEIAVVPDTAFSVASLLDGEEPSPRFARWRGEMNLKHPYVVIQAGNDLIEAAEWLKFQLSRSNEIQIVSLPIGPILGDDDANLQGVIPDALRLSEWPHPLFIAELIRNSTGVVCSSLHMSICALAFGVPVFRPANTFHGKFEKLSKFIGVFEIPSNGGEDWLYGRLGRKPVEPRVATAIAALDRHWTKTVDVLRKRDTARHMVSAARFLQSLPITLEVAQNAADTAAVEAAQKRSALEAALRQQIDAKDATIAELSGTIDAATQERLAAEASLRQQIDRLQAANAAQDQHLAATQTTVVELRQSTSWKLTAPLRQLRRLFSRQRGTSNRPILRFDRLASGKRETKPYEWAAVDRLFAAKDAAALARLYPHDKFKTVNGYDGEKSYAYEARALIYLGANSVAFEKGLGENWLRLANDLLSPSYRGAISRLSGRDMSAAPMEAYVCHFGADAWLGPHLDLKDKILTHVFYFNETWNDADGGCLKILNSKDMTDDFATISPIAGNSSILIRSDTSWHAVSKVTNKAPQSRRSMNVIFYRPGAKSTMWPEGDTTPLHDYRG